MDEMVDKMVGTQHEDDGSTGERLRWYSRWNELRKAGSSQYEKIADVLPAGLASKKN